MSPHYKTNIIFVHKAIVSLLIAFVASFIINENSVLAYSSSITTSGLVQVDVSSTGNGASVGTDDVMVNSTCPLGYTLTIEGPSDSNLYKGGDDTSNYSIASSAGTSDNPLPIIGDDGQGYSYMNTWGYTTESGATFKSNFIGLTNTATTLATKSSASASGGDTVSVHYGVSADKSLEVGLYTMANSGAVTYYLVQNPSCSTIDVVYDGNDASDGSMGTLSHSNVAENSSLDLYPSNYSRDGYGFAGWSTEQIDPDANNAATLISTAAANGNIYGPMATITADANFLSHATVSGNNLVVTLYAVWVKPVDNATLQDFICPDNTVMPVGSVIALKDQRDSNAYAVAKLADGNCWMIENLRLDNTNSDNSTGALAQGYHGDTIFDPELGGIFAGLADPEFDTFSDTAMANSLYYSGTPSGTASINIGTDHPGYRMPRYNNENTSSRASSPTDDNGAMYSYGNYYTWAAAIANTFGYSNTFPTDDNGNTSETAGTSICPKGWKLPYGKDTDNGATKGGFYYLGSQMGATASSEASSKIWRSYPNNFLYSGYYYGSSASSRGSRYSYGMHSGDGYYWTSTVYSIAGSYSLLINDSGVAPGTGRPIKTNGNSIRCLAITDYTVHFDANGGSGTMSDQTINVNTATALTSNAFTAPANSVFAGWNTAADGGGTSYTNGQSVTDITTPGKTITLYAQWEPVGYNVKVNFAGNGVSNVRFTASGYTTRVVSTSGGTANLVAGVQYTVTMNFVNANNYEFDSWALNSSSYGTLSSTSVNPTYFTPNANSGSAIITATGKVKVVYMQDLTLASCQKNVGSNGIGDEFTVYDKRDDKDYTVRYINGSCWMTQNLRFTETSLNLETSNVGVNKTISYGDLTSGDSNVVARIHESGDDTIGVWYNYAAASAMYIATNSNSNYSSYDICPKNWHLPTGPNTTADTDLNMLIGNTISDFQDLTAGLDSFVDINGGIYSGGTLGSSSLGGWWSGTAGSTTTRYALIYDGTNRIPMGDHYVGGLISGDETESRGSGMFVRCVRSS